MSAPAIPLHPFAHIDRVFDAQRAAFARHPYPGTRERQAHLDALRSLLLDHGDVIADAINEDFGHRARTETRLLELFPSTEGVKHARAHVARWMKPQRRETSLWFFPGRSRIVRQPLGVVGVIVPWNYPINMTFGPLAGAIAAGNRVMIKMSEFTPRTGELFAQLFAKYFTEDHVAVINGGVDAARAFSAKPWDHLLFTGSTAIGRDVMRAAADNLTPVTLELGGKSPVIIAPGFDVATAARRIMTGKCFNAGQTCIAPDYLLLPVSAMEEFSAAARAVVLEFYPTGAESDDYCSIINDRHYARVVALCDDARTRGATVSALADEGSPATRKLAPTLVSRVSDDMRIMQEEIFGPLLPIVGYNTLDDALAFVAARPRPLAMYYFDNDSARTKHVLQSTIAGGVTVNDTLFHFAQEALPFGGVGPSGMGRYHGEHGFNTFSVQKGVFHRSRFNVTKLFEPPFSPRLERLLKWVGRLGVVATIAVAAATAASAQGRCIRAYGTPACNTDAIKPVFERTGWRTTGIDHITFRVAEAHKEAAFYAALMGWKVQSANATRVVMNMGDWGTVVFRQVPADSFAAPGPAAGRGNRTPVRAVVESFGYSIEPWNAKNVEQELRQRGLTPVADNDGKGFESFHVKDPDGFDLQISNGKDSASARKSAKATLSIAAPFASTGWETVWLDHFSFNAANYKASSSFYINLLGWQPTYDEGSQNELMIGDVGDIIVRGGNPLDPGFSQRTGRAVRIDHISFGIAPWETDSVSAALEQRGLTHTIDTSDGAEIHVAQFKSYHTTTPNGFNLQISYNTHDTRLNLAIAVNPRRPGIR